MKLIKKPIGIKVNDMQLNFALTLSNNEIRETIKTYRNFYKNKKDNKGNNIKVQILY